MAFFAFLLLFILPLFSLLLFITKKYDHNLPPGPSRLPLIGNLHQLGDLPHHSLYELSRKHGPLMRLKLGSVTAIVASSADYARELLKTHDVDTCSRPPLTSLGKFSYGFSDIAFVPFGDQWRDLRKISMVHLLSTKKVMSFRWMREEEVERMVRSITSQMVTSDRVNLSEESLLLSNNVTCRSALGKTYYDEDPSGKGRLQEILYETQALLGAFFVGDYIPKLRWIDGVRGMRRRLEKNFRELDEFYQQVIEEHRDVGVKREKDEGDDQDVLDAMLDIQKTDARLTDNNIKAMLLVIYTNYS